MTHHSDPIPVGGKLKRSTWCRTLNSSTALEHIVPEALGCPRQLVFSDGTICQRCNNTLGHVDKAVIDDFDVVTFWYGVERKGFGNPSILSRGNLTCHYAKGEKLITLNMAPGETRDALGNIVTPYAGG